LHVPNKRKKIMADLDSGNIIRKVRHRLEVSQEGLSRLMDATKGAVQHWERGRNVPGLSRLLSLRQLCPPSPERHELDSLIRESKKEAGAITAVQQSASLNGRGRARVSHLSRRSPPGSLNSMRRDNGRLQRQVAKLESALKRREERLRILENLATDLQREMAQLRARHSG
jgi:transcriptional regulator with XRE-family HTH domain